MELVLQKNGYRQDMSVVYVTRRVHFSAAHRLHNPVWSVEQNESIFGLCSNANWHGHNYELEVTVKGTPNPETGYVLDFKKLKKILETVIISKVDHKNLNLDVDFMQGEICSSENFAIKIWQQLEPHFEKDNLVSIKLYETERNFVEYRGE